MRIAITGGTGFVGSHLATSLIEKGHRVVLLARGFDTRNMDVRQLERTKFVCAGIDNEDSLIEAFQKCDGVAHCAGINREIEDQTYARVHVGGTRNVVNAAREAGVKRILLTSFLRARPNCGSPYHESKFEAEEIVRSSGLDYTVLKAGMIYGKGDHLLDHLSHVFYTLPLFAHVGFKQVAASPLAIEDLVQIMEASLIDERLTDCTIAVLGPDKLTMNEVVRRVGKVVGRSPITFPMPPLFHYAFAKILERLMRTPLISSAQVRMLSEGFAESYGECDEIPDDLQPQTLFTAEQIRNGLPEPGPFKLEDLSIWHG